jgi:F0F1-type ATP synthase delta subunit
MKYLQHFEILENLQAAKSFLTKSGISLNDPNFIKIKEMIGNNVGYVLWFTKRFFEEKVPMQELETVWNIIKTEPKIISKFSTPLVNLESLEKFWDEYLDKKGQSQAKLSYNEFPNQQKGFINLESENDLKLLQDLYNDKDKSLFIKKISRYHDRKSLIDNLSRFLYQKTDDKYQTLLKSLKEKDVSIRWADESNDIIIVTVDYNQIRMFGSDTSWCIVNSEATFNSYNSEKLSQQFIIFLLDRDDNYSKIGVTTNMRGFKTAHLKNDAFVSKNKVEELITERGVDKSILYPSKENILKLDWDQFNVSVLLEVGFTKEEIIKRKNLETTDIMNLKLLGFDFNKVKKYVKNQSSELAKFISKKTRKGIIRIITGNDYGYSVPWSWKDRDEYRKKLIQIIDLKSDDVDFYKLYPKLSRDAFGYPISAVRFFEKIYEIDKKIIKFIIEDYTRDVIQTLSLFINQNIYPEICLDILEELIVTKKSFDLNYRSMTIIKTNIVDIFPDTYQRLYDAVKSFLLGKKGYELHDYLQIYHSDPNEKVRETIKNLDFWNAQTTLTLEDIGKIFQYTGVNYNGYLVLDYCKRHGIEFGDGGYEFAKQLKNHHDSDLEFYQFCIENSIEVEKSYEDLFILLRSKRSKLTDYEKEKIKYLLSKRDDFEKKWRDFEIQDSINSAISETKSAAEYCWTSTGWKISSKNYIDITPEIWYKNYWPIIKDLNFNDISKTHDTYEGTTFVSTVVLMTKLGRLSELKNINYNFRITADDGSFHPDRTIRYLTKIIADTEWTNQKRTFMSLDYEERKSLYEWFDNKITEMIKMYPEKVIFFNRMMMIDWYIFDKKKFKKALEEVKGLRNNYPYYGRNDVVKYKTLRLAEIEKLLNYLAENDKFKEIENILSQFKLNATERRASRYIGTWVYKLNQQQSKRYREILDKYLAEPVKESLILSWSKFILSENS